MDLVRGRSQVGGEVSYPDKDIWVGLGYKAGKYDATIEAENGMSSFTAKVLAKPTSEFTLACQATSDLKSPVTGSALCAYKFNADGQVKAKFDGSKIDCAIMYKALPKVRPESRARVRPVRRTVFSTPPHAPSQVTFVGGVGIPTSGGKMSTGLACTMG